MAYTNNPNLDTYSTKRLPLIQAETADPLPALSSTTLGSMMVNVLPKKIVTPEGVDGWDTRTRHAVQAIDLPAGVTSSQVRGLYVWEKTQTACYLFCVIATGIYTSIGLPGTWTLVSSFANAGTGPVRFTEFISSTSVKSLMVVDGIEGYVFTSNAAGTKIVDADFPTPHIPFPIFLNGRVYLAKLNTGDIYNSDLDNPASWTAGNFVSSEVYPDDIQALVKLGNYILAIGLVGSEYFADVGNATGTPLARVENTSLPFGTGYANTLASTFDQAVLVSKNPDGNIVLNHIQGFQYKEIPCYFLNQVLPQIDSPALNSYKAVGHFWREAQDLYYTIVLDYTVNSNTDGVYGLVYTYCFNAQMWVQFTRARDVNANTYGYTLGHKSYPVFFAQPGPSGSGTIVAGQAFNGPFVGVLSESQRGFDTLYINSATPGVYAFLNTVTLSNLSFGTMNRKFMSRLGVDYINESDTTGATDSYVPRVTWWDTYGGSGTPVKLAGAYVQGSGGTDFPFIYQLGSFRHRWIRVECYGMVIFRYIDVDINKGAK